MNTEVMPAEIRPIHPFPARMAPAIVWDELPVVLNSRERLKILDPMSGSGTSLVCASVRGHHVIGRDRDPLALLISSVWCSPVPENLIEIATDVLQRARKRARLLKACNAFPPNADEESKEFVKFWFDDTNRIQITSLTRTITSLEDEKVRAFLWCALSRLIITKVKGISLAMDVSHSRPHRKYETAPITAFEGFLPAVKYIQRNSPFANQSRASKFDIAAGDARKLDIKSGTIDLIITSPPYLNAIDYLRGHKLSLVWMGHMIGYLRKVRTENIGTEVSTLSSFQSVEVERVLGQMGDLSALPVRQRGMLTRYLADMNQVLRECGRVLKPEGKAIFVLGDSSLRGTFISNSFAIEELAKTHSLVLEKRTTRPIAENRRYLPPPGRANSGSSMSSRMREEVILKFRREP